MPVDQEVEDDQIEDLYNEMVDGVRKVEIVKRQVMPHLESVVEARYYVEQMMKDEVKADLQENAGARLDPMGMQDDDDCEGEGEEEHEDYLYCDPAMI